MWVTDGQAFFFIFLFYDAVVLRRDTSTSSWLRELPLLSSSVAFLSRVEKSESVCRGVRGSSFKNRNRDLRFINTPNRNRRMAWYLQKLSPARMFTYFREVERENKTVNQKKKHSGGDRQSSGTVLHSACLSNGIFTYIWITEILTFSVLGYTVTNEAENSYVNTWLRAHFNANTFTTYVILTIIMR